MDDILFQIMIKCTINVLNVLIQHFKSNYIDYDTFKNHTVLKIKFLLDNSDMFLNSQEKETIQKLLTEYNKITTVYNTQ